MKHKLKISPSLIRGYLLIAQSVIPKKSFLPILDNIYVKVEGDNMTIKAGSSETQIIISIDTIGVSENFDVSVPAQSFIGVMNSLYVGEVIINYDSETKKMTISSGKNKYSMSCYDGSEYLVFNMVNPSSQIKVDGEFLSLAMKNAGSVANPADARPAMTGVNIEFIGNEMFIMGTDAYTGVVYNSIFSGDRFPETLISKEAINIIQSMKLNGEAVIDRSDKNIRITCGNTTIISRLIECKYPVLMNIMNKRHQSYINASKSYLFESLRRLKLFTSAETNRVELSISGNELTITATNESYGKDAFEVLEIENKGIGDIKIALNINFLMNIINNITQENISIYIGDLNQPVYFNPNTEHPKERWLLTPML